MFKVSGSLFVKTISGRNGAFNVGRLLTDIGEFSVKDTLLDQYDEGKYQGEFGISRIFPSHYVTGSRLVIEIRAVLETVALEGIDFDKMESPVEAEPDPIDQEPPPRLDPPETSQETSQRESETETPEDACNWCDVFGVLWPLGTSVKLDPTVDRARFRQQRDYLKAEGYVFQALGQVWVKSD